MDREDGFARASSSEWHDLRRTWQELRADNASARERSLAVRSNAMEERLLSEANRISWGEVAAKRREAREAREASRLAEAIARRNLVRAEGHRVLM